ncbi:MAG: histone family protein [Methanothrix sp.]|uniref:histone family protein n=2 Tax=Methanothrix sp. TaxID=90426 RepID=UPI0032AF4CB2|nr:histone family protein [Methanothrix sp.]
MYASKRARNANRGSFRQHRNSCLGSRGGSRMAVLPVAPVARLIRMAGAKRVSEDASIELAAILENYGIEIAKEAIDWANHAKRKTVRAEDIKEAAKRVRPVKQGE